jgi:hypothetical protein
MLDWLKVRYCIDDDVSMNRLQLIILCNEFLSNNLGVIELACKMSSLSDMTVAEIKHSEEMLSFAGIASETDHLPVDPGVREMYNADALQRLDNEIQWMEEHYHAMAVEACKRLLERVL